jgi:hypothetical protein
MLKRLVQAIAIVNLFGNMRLSLIHLEIRWPQHIRQQTMFID